MKTVSGLCSALALALSLASQAADLRDYNYDAFVSERGQGSHWTRRTA